MKGLSTQVDRRIGRIARSTAWRYIRFENCLYSAVCGLYVLLVSDGRPDRQDEEEDRRPSNGGDPSEGAVRNGSPASDESEVALGTLRGVFQAAEELKGRLSVNEETFVAIAPEAHSAPGDFFVFEALDEVQKMAAALIPLSGIAASAVGDERDAVVRIVEESFIDQSALWQRKLVEVLADVICFRLTSSPEFFSDYLLLARLDQVLTAQKDARNFWGAESANQSHQIKDLIQEIGALEENGLAVDRAWYRKRRASLPDAPVAGQLFASFEKRLKNALAVANETEKVALGLSYGWLFSRTSASVHARPGRIEDRPEKSLMGGVQIPTLIGISVLVGCQQLVGQVPTGYNEFFRSVLDNNVEAEKLVGQMTDQRAVAGDLVLAHGELCEVVDVASGPFGYKSYKVRYLSNRLIPEIEEDYVASPQMRVFFNIEGARAMVAEQMSAGRISKRTGAFMLEMPDADLLSAFRESVVELWNSGVGFKEAVMGRDTREA
jgi:hypothetical protein